MEKGGKNIKDYLILSETLIFLVPLFTLNSHSIISNILR